MENAQLQRKTRKTFDGNQTLKHDPRGNRITSVYDGVNQLTGQLYAARRNTFSYDPVGNRTVMADETGTYTTAYTRGTTPAASPIPTARLWPTPTIRCSADPP